VHSLFHLAKAHDIQLSSVLYLPYIYQLKGRGTQ